ncbi:MAG: tRNA (adenosine(37)-N6)-dimethylallyltransferase MiaA [Candidatus Saccharimonadales bacterium]
MATENQLIVITGPTASGKTALAIELAEQFNGEIICADSRTVYRGMDIGTAKPTPEEQAQVPHHLLDVVNPDERYTVSMFQEQARATIEDIRSRGKIPFLVGGSGLYIDSVILNYKLGKDRTKKRAGYELMDKEQLRLLLKERQISVPQNEHNKRHLIRALEQGIINTTRSAVPQNGTIVVAIATEKAERDRRIAARADEIFAGPILQEAETLALRYGWEHESMTGNIYPLARQVLEGTMSIAEAKQRFIIKDRQLAKRQITWLKRHDFVLWLSLEEARTYLYGVLE